MSTSMSADDARVTRDPESVNRGSTGVPMSVGRPAGDGGARSSRRSIGELIARIADGLKTLTRQEAELAKIEVAEAISDRARGAGALGAAGVTGLFAVGFIAAAGAAALALILPLWAALLIMGGAFSMVAVVALLVGRYLMRKTPISVDRTTSTLKENLRWARAQIRR